MLCAAIHQRAGLLQDFAGACRIIDATTQALSRTRLESSAGAGTELANLLGLWLLL